MKLMRTGLAGGAVLISVWAVACGGGGGSSSPTAPSATPAPAPTIPAPTVSLPGSSLYSGSFTNYAQTDAGRGAFTTTGPGTLHVAVEWTPSSTNIAAALTDQTCSSASGAIAGTCSNIGAPQTAPGMPKTWQVTTTDSLQGYIYLANMSGAPATGTVRVNFVATPAATPTPAPTPRPTPTPSLTCNGASVPGSVDCGTPTAKCNDGSYSCSQNRQGTCSSHNGVACWVCPGPLC